MTPKGKRLPFPPHRSPTTSWLAGQPSLSCYSRLRCVGDSDTPHYRCCTIAIFVRYFLPGEATVIWLTRPLSVENSPAQLRSHSIQVTTIVVYWVWEKKVGGLWVQKLFRISKGSTSSIWHKWQDDKRHFLAYVQSSFETSCTTFLLGST